ncbi:MAG: hypothetical protein J6S73_09340, partial [Lentisphaeria bacterium]|nr:hypothetical protein [Lentisphaeria bacterium]
MTGFPADPLLTDQGSDTVLVPLFQGNIARFCGIASRKDLKKRIFMYIGHLFFAAYPPRFSKAPARMVWAGMKSSG